MKFSNSLSNKIPSTRRKVTITNVRWIIRNILRITPSERIELSQLLEKLESKTT